MKEKEEIYSITSNFYSTETKNVIKLFANKLSDTPFYQNIEIRVYDENQKGHNIVDKIRYMPFIFIEILAINHSAV